MDWIESFVKATAPLPSPEQFRLWAGITAVSGVMERKVWTTLSGGPLYPHLLTLLVGPPASGKTQAINQVRNLWSKMQGLYLAPNNVTKAALIDAMSRAMRTVISPDGTGADTFCAMCIPVSEFGVFFPSHDLEFLSVMNDIFDCPPLYREERRTSGVFEVVKPHLVMLAGTQPDFLASILPEEAWGMGFTSRIIMIYGTGAPPQDLFATAGTDITGLAGKLGEIFELAGEMEWTEEARRELNSWNASGCPPAPDHSRLQHYLGRRALHTIKLSMISAVSRTRDMVVHLEDFERAREWLLSAEDRMPDVFKAMGQKSDAQLVYDMHFELYRRWAAVPIASRKPLAEKDLYSYLMAKVPSERISRVIETAEKCGAFARGAYPGEWIPRPMQEWESNQV